MRKYLWIISILFAVIGAPDAQAQTTYTYTGNDFTTFSNLTCPSDCSIDGSFTVPSPLAAGTTTTNVTPTAFDFYISTADSPTWTNLNGATPELLSIQTNSNGAIISWDMEFYFPNVPYIIFGPSIDYFNNTSNAPTDEIYAYNSDNPGTWTSANLTPTPEPTSLTLWLLGIFAVGIMTHRARTAKRPTPSLL